MAFIVNSAPGAGLRFEPSVTLDDAPAAVEWAAGLTKRGMRLVRIKNTITNEIYDEVSLRKEIKRAKEEKALEQATAPAPASED